MGHPVSLSTPLGRISGWRADPPFEPRGAIILIQEIFGVTSHIRRQVDRFAAHGFICVAPAFFDHIDYRIELPYNDEGVARGRALVEELGFDKVLGDVRSVVAELAGEANVGVVGYCWGGTVAYLCNTRLGLPAVSYYGGRTMPFVRERLKAPMEFHFGQYDPIISPEDVAATKDAHPEATFYVYEAGHGFNCDERGDYHPESANIAMDHTVTFMTRVLRTFVASSAGMALP
ncbi:MAG: dienelactone hydrolase family protein [Xanthomonadales bacterium]|nr:dienelactone hydrolase family protein [Xanthomonadales bacterium]